MFKKKKFRKTGIAFGGGAALGAAHVGVLKALKEHNFEPEFLSGTSIGAYVAAHVAFGTPLDELEEMAKNLDWLDITGFKMSKMGLLSNERLGKKVLEQLGKVNIEDSKIPLCMIATDLTSGEKVVLKEGPLYKAVMASTCLPGIFVPVEWGDMLLVDGVFCENVPVTPLKEMGAKDIIGVDLTTNRKYKRPETFVDVLNNTFDIGLNNLVKEQTEDKRVFWIQPALGAYNMADTRKAEHLIEEGYKAGMERFS
ncbi:MAG: patatin-like phospholipase family protein [Balneolaceae bacterium]|nr:patatin-like phospholipase family protein [Balneolaceae bacterium]MCH8548523.1 patatin-like phospholipase family protein [Balneolaceae bacterium]